MLDKCSAKLLELTINERTWSELLRDAGGAPPSSVYWHLRKLIKCGMVEARGRRRVRYRATLKGGTVTCAALGCAGAIERTADELGVSLIEAAAIASAFMRIVDKENLDLMSINLTREGGLLGMILAQVMVAPGNSLEEKVVNSLGDASLTPMVSKLLDREGELLKRGGVEGGGGPNDDLNPL